MMGDFHFLRPEWLLALIPLCILAITWLKSPVGLSAWNDVCDPHLLPHLLHKQGKKSTGLLSVILSALLMIFAISGPVWQRMPVPVYDSIQPRVILLDMSRDMLDKDIKPSRLARAKFILKDLLKAQKSGQTGLVVYTSEAFVVSPLTADTRTIENLLPMLHRNVLPVDGMDLSAALKQAESLIHQSDFSKGQVLVLTGSPPNTAARDKAESLSDLGIKTSIVPLVYNKNSWDLFRGFAKAGDGTMIPYDASNQVLERWLSQKQAQTFKQNDLNHIPQWRDEGRWFLIPALLFLLPLFRKGWLQRTFS